MTRRALILALAIVLPVLPAHAQEPDDPPDDPIEFAPTGMSEDRFPAATTPQWVDVEAHDGVLLAARVYRPDTSSDPDWKTPVVLVHSPYYGAQSSPGSRSLDLVTRYTPKGYTVVLSSVRGTGDSGGCLEQDGPNQAKDFKTLVEHFAAQPWSNGRVASYGKSYDAETQNAGAVLRPKGLATMITVAGISSLYDVGYFDGVPFTLGGLAASAAYATTGPLVVPTERTRYIQRVTCYADVYGNSLDPTGDETPFWALRNFRYGVEDVEASVLYVHGLSDFTVSPIAIDGWYDEIPSFKRAIFGQWAHWYPYDAPNALARDDWYQTVDAWLDHELLGLDTGIGNWPPVQVQAEDNTWRAVRSFAGMGVEQSLAMGASALGEAGGEGATRTYQEGASLTWDGPTLEEATQLSGQAFVDVTITLDMDDAHLAATLQEVRSNGSVRTLTRGYLSVQHQEDPNRGHAVTPDHPVPYRIRTYPFDKTVAAGSRLRLLLGGSDSSTRAANNRHTATVHVDGRSVLRVPVVQEVCSMVVARRTNGPGQPGLCVDQRIPDVPARHDPGAARGHVATARIIATGAETIEGVQAIRETGYLTVRDGVELALEIVRPAGDGPFPVLLTYDGYNAGRDPDPGYAARYLPRGYALAGLSVRGTGCSGGVFDFFQPSEGPDGYEMVEWLADRPWSTGRVGMIGKSYPGITQLFVAEAQPPSLAAITPGHHYLDAYRDVAFPGGILNYAFAGLWSLISQPAPGVQSLPDDLAAADETCARNLDKHARNARTNPLVQAQEHPHDNPFIQNRSPLRNLHRIRVPVYTTTAWQDETLASRQVHTLEVLEDLGIPYRAVLSNGDHNMYRRDSQLIELDRFLEAHVERREVLRDGTPREDYFAEPPVTVHWEQAGNEPRWTSSLDAWGDQAQPMALYLSGGGRLRPEPPTATSASAQYTHNATGTQGIANPRHGHGSLPDVPTWDKYSPPPGTALAFTSDPFSGDTVLLGSASADLWVRATAPNVDLQVTLTEIRPDGQEVYVQQGWLRGRQRALDDHASTAMRPVQTHRVEDVAPLSMTEPSLARVEIFPFGHLVREGSRLRLWVEAPTMVPQLWGFALDPTPARVDVQLEAAHPSRLVLPVAGGIQIPQAAKAHPVCGQPIRQPCRADPGGTP